MSGNIFNFHSDLYKHLGPSSESLKNFIRNNFSENKSYKNISYGEFKEVIDNFDNIVDGVTPPNNIATPDKSELSDINLGMLPESDSMWFYWNERFTDADYNTIRENAWRHDVRVVSDNEPCYQFPIFDLEGELKSIMKWSPENYKYKYFMTGDKNGSIYNEHLVDWGSRIYLVEGIWDAIIGGRGAIPLFSSTLPRGTLLESRIRQYKPPEVVVCLDQDATRKAKTICKKLKSWGINTYLAIPPQPDPADCGVPIDDWVEEVMVKYDWESRIKMLIEGT